MELERQEAVGMFNDDEPEPLMTDAEFEEGLAEAAQGRGELFENVSIEEFKDGR